MQAELPTEGKKLFNKETTEPFWHRDVLKLQPFPPKLLLSLSFQSVPVIRWARCTTAVMVPASVSVKTALQESSVRTVSPVTIGNRAVSVSTSQIH